MKMSKRSIVTRAAIGTVGGLMLIGVASAALADPLEDDDVAVNVEIAPQEPMGALTLTVAQTSTALTEGAAETDGTRVFNGTLPTVTVTDDRADVPTGVYWYVTGQASDFTGASDELTAGNLGWTPALLTAEGNGEVTEGEPVDTVLDETPDSVGLVGEELLALALDSGEAATVGTWQANAGLVLKAPAGVTPGSYSSTVTLTLWEDAIQ